MWIVTYSKLANNEQSYIEFEQIWDIQNVNIHKMVYLEYQNSKNGKKLDCDIIRIGKYMNS